MVPTARSGVSRSKGSCSSKVVMAYKVVPEPGEKVEAQIELNLSKKAQPFSFSITNRALYIPRIKFIAKSDPFYFQRVPLDQVRHVAVTRLRPYHRGSGALVRRRRFLLLQAGQALKRGLGLAADFTTR